MVCSIGNFLKGKCTSSNKYLTCKHFSSRQWSLLKLRSGVPSLISVCGGHASQFGQLYAASQKQCCNPLKLHTVVRRKNLKQISAKLHDRSNQTHAQVIEGRRLCIQCYQAITEQVANDTCLENANCEDIVAGKSGKIIFVTLE